jgi:hypothetical protein
VVKTSTNGITTGAVAASVGTGLGTLVIWFLNSVGVDLPPAAGAALAGGIATITAYITSHGVVGFGQLIWRGSDYMEEQKPEIKPSPPKPKPKPKSRRRRKR